jgi:hypothetical protein
MAPRTVRVTAARGRQLEMAGSHTVAWSSAHVGDISGNRALARCYPRSSPTCGISFFLGRRCERCTDWRASSCSPIVVTRWLTASMCTTIRILSLAMEGTRASLANRTHEPS